MPYSPFLRTREIRERPGAGGQVLLLGHRVSGGASAATHHDPEIIRSNSLIMKIIELGQTSLSSSAS